MCFQVGAGLEPRLQTRKLHCQVTPLGTRHADLQPEARAWHCLGTLGVYSVTERPPGTWHHAQSVELPAVEIKWKLFLLTSSPISDSDASGWVAVPTAPSGHVYSVICPVVPAGSSVMVCPSNVYWKPSSKILGWPSCRPAPFQYIAGVPKTLLWSLPTVPCLTPVSSPKGFLWELLLLPHLCWLQDLAQELLTSGRSSWIWPLSNTLHTSFYDTYQLMCSHYLSSGCPQSELLKDKAQLPHFPVASRTGPASGGSFVGGNR